MASDLQSAVQSIILNDYASLAITTAVAYDYILTFASEVEYIWRRPWSWVSTVFALIRYVGLCWALSEGLTGSSFIPGHLKCRNNMPRDKGTVMYVVGSWTFPIFLCAFDFMMILRVYAMWGRSKAILFLLLLLYIPQNIAYIVCLGIYNNPTTHFSVSTVQILNFSFCNASFVDTPPSLYLVFPSVRFVLSGALLALAVFQTLHQSFVMYKATKRWQPNRYMQLFVQHGIFYFLVHTLNGITELLQGEPPQDNVAATYLYVISYVLITSMMPRFVISVRMLFDREIRRGGSTTDKGIDTGFGVSSRWGAREGGVFSSIAFAEPVAVVEQDQSQVEDSEVDCSSDIRLETRAMDAQGVVAREIV